MSLDAKLADLEKLEYDWDGYKSPRPSRSAIETIRHLTAVPMSSGGIQLVMYAGHAEIEIEVDDNGRVSSVFWRQA